MLARFPAGCGIPANYSSRAKTIGGIYNIFDQNQKCDGNLSKGGSLVYV